MNSEMVVKIMQLVTVVQYLLKHQIAMARLTQYSQTLLKDLIELFKKTVSSKSDYSSPILIQWIIDYLATQLVIASVSVSVGGSYCRSLPATSNVPHSCVLRLLLCLLYFNNLVSVVVLQEEIKLGCLQMIVCCYSEILCSRAQDQLNSNLDNVLPWCNEFCMDTDTGKTVRLKITCKISMSLRNEYTHIHCTMGINCEYFQWSM